MFVRIVKIVASIIAVMLVMASSSRSQHVIDYLYPISPYYTTNDSLAFRQKLAAFDILLNGSNPILWMIVDQDQGREYSVFLRETSLRDTSSKRYELEYAIPKTPMMVCEEVREGVIECKVDENVEIMRSKTYLPIDVAEEVIGVWKAVVKQTRYQSNTIGGLHGAWYYVYAEPDYYGQIWSPIGGKPRMLVDLGKLLIEWSSPEFVHGETLDDIRDLVGKISNEFE